MSEENVAFILKGVEEFNAVGGWNYEERWHANGLLTGPEGWPEKGPFRGSEAIQRQFERLVDDYSESRIAGVEAVAHHGDWVVIRFLWETRGRASDIETATEMNVAFRVIDGKVAEAHYRWRPEEALEAAGLSK